MTARITRWLTEPLPPAVAHAVERLARVEDAVALAIMPDVHLAEGVCVGTAVATRRLLLPAAIGGDLGCGMAAIRFDLSADAVAGDEAGARRLLERIERVVPTLTRRGPSARSVLPEPLESWPLSAPALAKLREREGRREFATLGRGNHFLELQRDDAGWLWLMVHSGSRALGPAIAGHHRRTALLSVHGFEAIEAESEEGYAFRSDLEFALRWADASRRTMVDTVAAELQEAFGAAPDRSSFVHCTHNFVRRETIGGEPLWVHRKGAIAAAAGEAGIIPGSMAAPSFHVEGRGCEAALNSSSHGAGRLLARGEARRRISAKELVRSMRGVWFDTPRAAALVDEAPAAYKEVGAVMRAQRDLTRIVRRLQPVLNWKGG